MDRNREARRTTTTSMAAAPNGLSRRRHRSSSLRDSPDEDGPVELLEPARLRDRGGLKKDRDRDRDRERDRERDRDRDRDRDRSSRSKRRRENRMMGNREDGGGDDTSEESVNDEDDDDEDDGSLRMLPPQPSSNLAAASVASMSNHNNLNNHNHHHHPHNRKSFPPAAAKVFRPAPAAAAPPAGWKAADEMIGVSVPRKARSASTKRSHDWISGASGGGVSGSGVGGTEQNHRQSSTSPVRLMSAASPAAAAPVSPSSSNASVRKKMKPNGGGIKPRPPKSSSKSSSSNPEELEIEIAEVLYGLMTQSQAPSKKEIESNKFDSNKSSSDNKSRVSSPISNSTAPLPQNSSSSAVPLSAVAPKRKRPRQVSETMGNFNVRSSPGSSMKNEIDHQSPKTEGSSQNLDNNSGSAAENAVSFDFASSQKDTTRPPELSMEEDGKCGDAAVLTSKEEVVSPKESYAVRLEGNLESKISTAPSSTSTTKPSAVPEIESQKEEKFEIDLMAPPPQLRSSPERDGDIDFADHKLMASQIDTDMKQMVKGKEDEKLAKACKEEAASLPDGCEEKASKGIVDQMDESKRLIPNEERSVDLRLDLEKTEKDATSMLSSSTSNRSQNQVVRHQQQIPASAKSTRDEISADKTGSLPLPMSVASWPNGVPQMGYVAPLQGVVSMDGNTMSSTPIQPIFTQPRPKRCATHCYIARNILYLQQFMRMSPFWPAAAAAGSAPMFGAKPCNLNVMPAAELHGSIVGRSLNSVQDKGQGTAIFPGHNGKDKSSQAANSSDPAQRKQPILLQQALPSVAPNNILHGPAFIFPINQQPVAAASVRPGSSKSPAAAGGLAASTAANSATASASATPAAAMSFNYPNMTPNETQYLAILQNNPYPFPIPAVGAPPNYRGSPHAQAMPLFNGSFYSSQMIHPSHLQQQPPPPSSQSQQVSQAHQISSGSSSQKHLQIQQQRQQGTAVNGGNGSGNLHNYSAPKGRSTQQSQQQHNQHINPPQARHLESEVAGEDSPSTADSRVSRAPTINLYGHSFGMPIHPQNFAVMTPPPVLSNNASGSSNEKKQQQQQPQQQSQQQGLKRGVESFPPQTFAMSFSPMNGTSTTSIDLSTMAQNHAILSTLHQDSRQNYHQIVAAAAAHQAQQKKNFRVSEESKTGGAVPDSSNADEERKVGGLAGKGVVQSIAFSRPDLADASASSTVIPGNSVIDSSSRNLNLASGSSATARSSRTSPMSNSVGASNSHIQAQLHQQQQIMQLQKHQQQNQQNQQLAASLAARSKNPPSSNGSVYPEHLITSSSSVTAKFPNSLSSYPQSLVQTTNSSSSPTQSPQWKNSARGTPSPVPSSLASSTASSLKSHPTQQPQQTGRTHQQSHTQISFGGNQKSSTSQAVPQQQGPTGNSSSQCASPPMVVGSPTTSSISKGASGSPRTNASVSTSNKTTGQASSLSSHQSKTSTTAAPSQRSSQSILGNPHITSSSASATTKSQQQQQQQQQHMSKQSMQQAQLYFSNPYMQVQHSGNSAASSAATSGYYIQNLQRRRPEQQNQQQQQPPSLAATSSTGMLSLCPPVTLANATTSDPTKAIAAAVKGSGLATQPGILHAQFTAAGQSSGNMHQLMSFPYVHPVPAAVQVKTAEQKQPAGNDNLHACWQPEKK